VVVFDTSNPACANVLGVQMSANVPAPAVCDPQAWVLRIQRYLLLGSAVCVLFVGTHARAIRRVGPVATEKAHIVHQRVCACLPQRAHRAAVDTAREEADARDDVMASLWRLKQCLRCAGALKGRGCVGQVELRHAGVQADQHGVRAEFDRIRYKIAAMGM